MRNLKKFKYTSYLVTTSFLIAFGLLGVIFISVDSTGGFHDFASVFGSTLLFENTKTPLAIVGTILIYDGFVAVFISLLIALSIATDVYATSGDRLFFFTSIIPLIGNIHALIRMFSESNLTLSQAVEAEQIEENVRTAIVEETNEIKAYKIDQEKAVKLAAKNKVFITISKRKDKKTKVVSKVWSCIDHRNKTKAIFKTKKEALQMAAKISNPKTVVIHNANGKFEYWLTYLDDSNIPIIKAPKNTLAEFENGENEVLKILEVKAVAKKAPEIKPVARKQIKQKIVEEVSVEKNDIEKVVKTRKQIQSEIKKDEAKRPDVLAVPTETKVVEKVVKVVKTVVSGDDPTLETQKKPITEKLTDKKKAIQKRKEQKAKAVAKKKKAVAKEKAVAKKPVAKKKAVAKKPVAKKKAVAKKPVAKKKAVAKKK